MTTNKLLQHFKRMQLEAGRYIEPDSGVTDRQFITTILRYVDGPEQREAELEASFDYQTEALRTESLAHPVNGGSNLTQTNRILHAAMGMATESGEFLDPIKKHLFYGKPLDLVNLREEVGDILWYIAIACSALDTTIEAEMQRNIAKLRKRYPEKFDSVQAVERDLEGERKVLENGNA